jgi:hypothetical protein
MDRKRPPGCENTRQMKEQLAAGSGSEIAATLPGIRGCLNIYAISVEATNLIFEDGELRSTEFRHAMVKDRIPAAYAQRAADQPARARLPSGSVRMPPYRRRIETFRRFDCTIVPIDQDLQRAGGIYERTEEFKDHNSYSPVFCSGGLFARDVLFPRSFFLAAAVACITSHNDRSS